MEIMSLKVLENPRKVLELSCVSSSQKMTGCFPETEMPILFPVKCKRINLLSVKLIFAPLTPLIPTTSLPPLTRRYGDM